MVDSTMVMKSLNPWMTGCTNATRLDTPSMIHPMSVMMPDTTVVTTVRTPWMMGMRMSNPVMMPSMTIITTSRIGGMSGMMTLMMFMTRSTMFVMTGSRELMRCSTSGATCAMSCPIMSAT